MKVNPKIREILNEISTKSFEFSNDCVKNKKYLRKILRIFKDQLTEDEQIYVLHTLLELLHYKNITIDPEMVITMDNIKLRHYFTVMLTVFGFIVLLGIVFFQTGVLTAFLEKLLSFLKFLNAL